jgi:predicted O-methyltransferase YrrM
LYSRLQLAKKYFHYYLTASNGRGHGIHSPFVFDFVKNVLRDNKRYDWYPIIETARQKLLQQKGEIEVEDRGAGSSVIKTNKRAVADIAKSSLKSPKYAQLLSRIVKHYQPQTILELGTSFGISTCYIAAANAQAKVYSIEGSPAIAGIAKKTFEHAGLNNIELIEGDFDEVLPSTLSKIPGIDFAFIDGNHRSAPTLSYFRQILAHASANSILIFDDIHWSAEMEEAWTAIQQHPQTMLSIDLFFLGIVFLNPDFKIKQQFTIRF